MRLIWTTEKLRKSTPGKTEEARERGERKYFLYMPIVALSDSALHSIWEKKYGRNANHVKKQVAEGAKDARPPFKRPAGRAQGNSRPRPQGQPYQKPEPPVHPSVPIRKLLILTNL